MQLLKRVVSVVWVTLHSVAYLVIAGVIMANIGGGSAGVWLALGWIMLMPTLLAPSLVAQWYHRSRNGRSDQTAHKSTRVSARITGSSQ